MKRIYIFLITIFSLLLTSNLTVAQLPGLWGMTSQGGPDNMGVIFKTDGSGDNQNVAYSFVKEYEGAQPYYTELVQASNGKLYGMTLAGGAYGGGVFFEYDPATDTNSKKLKPTLIDLNGEHKYYDSLDKFNVIFS